MMERKVALEPNLHSKSIVTDETLRMIGNEAKRVNRQMNRQQAKISEFFNYCN